MPIYIYTRIAIPSTKTSSSAHCARGERADRYTRSERGRKRGGTSAARDRDGIFLRKEVGGGLIAFICDAHALALFEESFAVCRGSHGGEERICFDGFDLLVCFFFYCLMVLFEYMRNRTFLLL